MKIIIIKENINNYIELYIIIMNNNNNDLYLLLMK